MIFYGLEYNKDSLENVVKDMIFNKLKANQNLSVKRILPIHNGPVLISFYNEEDKFQILKNVKNLKGTRISVQEDLIEATRKRRSKLVKIKKEVDELKIVGLRTRMIKDQLIVESTKFTWTEGRGLLI